MQRALSKAPWQAGRHLVLSRSGSSGVGPPQFSHRWAEQVRSESNILTVDDPPTAPLPENHEAGDGIADFSNFVDKNEDVSTGQAVVGLGSMLLFSYGIYKYATYSAKKAPPLFTRREFPNVEKDFPTWPGAADVPR